VIGFLIWVIFSNRADLQREGSHSTKPPGRVSRSPAGDAVLTIDPVSQANIGLRIEPLQAFKLPREVAGYARVLDPDSLVAAIEELAAAEAEVEAARVEHDRLQTFQESVKGVARRVVEAAKADLAARQGRARALAGRLTSVWGEGLASLPAAEREALVKHQAALVRVDLPPGEVIAETPAGAAVVPLAAGDARMNADRVFEAAAVDEKIQGQSFVLYFKSPARTLRPGAVLSAYLQVPGEPAEGVLIPRSAVVRLEGMPWVYVHVPPDKFFRREVKLDSLLEPGWFTRSGFDAESLVVVTGAQALLSDELRYQIQLEDE
jgi:hypothetical protein